MDEYTFLTEYTSSTKPITIKHKCGHVYTLGKASAFLRGIRCSNCASQSKAAKTIEKTLNSLGYKTSDNLLTEVMFSNLKDEKYLRFDFALFRNNYLLCLIEYDGEFHDIPHPKRDRDSFKKVKNHDKLKDEYCIKNSIPLLRIHYTEKEDITAILNKFLSSTTIENINFPQPECGDKVINMSRVESEANADSKSTAR